MRQFPTNKPERRKPANKWEELFGAEGVEGSSPYDTFMALPGMTWGEDWYMGSFIQSSPDVMPRDAPVPESPNDDNYEKLGIDPMQVAVVSRAAQISYLLTEYDRLVYLANQKTPQITQYYFNGLSPKLL